MFPELPLVQRELFWRSFLNFTRESSLRTSALTLTTQRRIKAERTFLSAGALLNDEFSMISVALINAGSLITTYARETKFRLRREDYALPRQHFGRIPCLAWAGDHLQLSPIFKKNSVFAPLEHTSQKHRVSVSIFRNSWCFSVTATAKLLRRLAFALLCVCVCFALRYFPFALRCFAFICSALLSSVLH